MIASCWDWPSLKYAYFIIEDLPLDAGGWSPTRGIVANAEVSSAEGSISFDDCLPALPKNCLYAGSGDFCVGELYTKRDSETRPSLDMDMMRSQGTPDIKKIVELLDGTSVSAVDSFRGVSSDLRMNAPGEPLVRGSRERRSLWSFLVPSFAAIGTGFAMYRLFDNESRTDLNVKVLLFAWASGLAVGLTVGQEYAEQPNLDSKEEP